MFYSYVYVLCVQMCVYGGGGGVGLYDLTRKGKWQTDHPEIFVKWYGRYSNEVFPFVWVVAFLFPCRKSQIITYEFCRMSHVSHKVFGVLPSTCMTDLWPYKQKQQTQKIIGRRGAIAPFPYHPLGTAPVNNTKIQLLYFCHCFIKCTTIL